MSAKAKLPSMTKPRNEFHASERLANADAAIAIARNKKIIVSAQLHSASSERFKVGAGHDVSVRFQSLLR